MYFLLPNTPFSLPPPPTASFFERWSALQLFRHVIHSAKTSCSTILVHSSVMGDNSVWVSYISAFLLCRGTLSLRWFWVIFSRIFVWHPGSEDWDGIFLWRKGQACLLPITNNLTTLVSSGFLPRNATYYVCKCFPALAGSHMGIGTWGTGIRTC